MVRRFLLSLDRTMASVRSILLQALLANFNLRSSPSTSALIFFAIPTTLFFFYPISFWAVTDNELLGLGNALNMAYRLADRQLYHAPGIMWHPGVTFYLLNWIALALSGHPVATGGFDFFQTVIAQVEVYHRYIILLAALVGAAGVYVFVRSSRTLVPFGITAIGLVAWLLSTPATLTMFLSPGFESFAILINGLFFAVLAQIAYTAELSWRTVVLAGCISALAYLNKLSYIYILMAFATAIFAALVARRVGWIHGLAMALLFVAAFTSIILAAAYFIIGWEGFQAALAFQKGVILGSGLYGFGDPTVVSGDEIRKAILAIGLNRAYALPVALIIGLGLVVGGLVMLLQSTKQAPVAVLCIGSGVAGLLAALIVLKHYEIHYTAGVSATLPACVVAGYLLAQTWSFRAGLSYAVTASTVVGFIAYLVTPMLGDYVTRSTELNKRIQADKQELDVQIDMDKRLAEFVYKAPFAEFGEGFVLVIAEIPRLSEEYLQRSRRTISNFMARRIDPDVGLYVLDKTYFPDEAAIKRATNLDIPETSAPRVIKYMHGDRLIELRTVFILVRASVPN